VISLCPHRGRTFHYDFHPDGQSDAGGDGMPNLSELLEEGASHRRLSERATHAGTGSITAPEDA
jgi:hypothetical protein